MTKAAALGFHQESEWDSQLGENTWLKKKKLTNNYGLIDG
jgi:hypothetical protein